MGVAPILREGPQIAQLSPAGCLEHRHLPEAWQWLPWNLRLEDWGYRGRLGLSVCWQGWSDGLSWTPAAGPAAQLCSPQFHTSLQPAGLTLRPHVPAGPAMVQHTAGPTCLLQASRAAKGTSFSTTPAICGHLRLCPPHPGSVRTEAVSPSPICEDRPDHAPDSLPPATPLGG